MYENFAEGFTRECRLIYNVDNLKTESAIVPLNLSTPTWMRGPGDCSGDFAIESTVDELSYAIKMDPVEFRLKNISNEKDPETGKPWSTNYLSECITRGAERIEWKNRSAKPGALSDGDWKIGYGMAVGMWGAGRQNASAGIKMQKDGSIIVQTAMTDIGTGTRLVFNCDGLSDFFSKLLSNNASNNIDATPGRKAHHNLNRLIWKRLGKRPLTN